MRCGTRSICSAVCVIAEKQMRSNVGTGGERHRGGVVEKTQSSVASVLPSSGKETVEVECTRGQAVVVRSPGSARRNYGRSRSNTSVRVAILHGRGWYSPSGTGSSDRLVSARVCPSRFVANWATQTGIKAEKIRPRPDAHETTYETARLGRSNGASSGRARGAAM